MHAPYFQLDMIEDEDKSLNLCCCEYMDANDERNHILGCCCNCAELDMCVDRLFKCKGMAPRTLTRLGAVLQDRLRVPWRGGARQLNIDSIIPIILLPTLGYIAAQGVWISVIVFTSLPIFLIYTHYIFMRISSQTKFFYVWTLVSVVLIVTVFELPVVVTLDIQPEEHKIFLLFTILMVFCGVKTRLTADQSHVKGDIKMEESLLECAICHKSVLPRTFHCCICRTCVIKRDQHCAWLDCCIGESNYRWYMASLMTAVCQLALCSNLILTTACHPFTVFATIMLPDDCSDVYFDILYATIFVTALYAILAMLFLLVLLLHECWLISLGMTGHEWRNLSDKVCCGVPAKRPYSKGFLRNWTDFFLDGNFITSTVTLGLCISVTFHKNDSIDDLNYMAKKVLNLKLFNENLSNKPWKMDIKQKGYGITVLKEKRLISRFNGTVPIFDDAMETRFAYKFYKMFIKLLRQLHDPKLIKGTSFRKPVRVNIIHDGPAIFVLHSPKSLKRSPREKFIAAYGTKYFVD